MKKLAFLDSSIKPFCLIMPIICFCLDAYASPSNSDQEKTESSVSSLSDEIIEIPNKKNVPLFKDNVLFNEIEDIDWLNWGGEFSRLQSKVDKQSSVEVPFKSNSHSEQSGF